MDFPNMLMELGEALGLGKLEFNDDGLCRLVFDGKLTVDIELAPDGEGCFFYSTICTAPSESEADLYAALLEANLFGGATGKAVFALDSNRGEILLWREIEGEQTDFQSFSQELERFVNHVEHWGENLKEMKSGKEAGASSIPGPGTFMRA